VADGVHCLRVHPCFLKQIRCQPESAGAGPTMTALPERASDILRALFFIGHRGVDGLEDGVPALPPDPLVPSG
jgi:hypothetical protein